MKDIFEKLGLFYLGKDSNDDSLTLYKSKHLTTHAMLVGMTGSGKTGLGIGLIEEAAIDNIPSIIIDPKGDMGNLCLAFPKMQGEDFEPWVEASNADETISQKADFTASMWENGLIASGQDKSRVEKFAQVEKTIYTPGSSAGVSVNILASFSAPSTEILEDSDTLASLINTTVSSLLSLIAIKSDNINSKEHLLLSNIIYHFWLKGVSLSLEDIIGYVASPPFKKIGMLPLSSFYTQDQRMKLAMLLNGVASSVTFSSWIKGETLDIQNMLYDENGKAKVAIFSIAHLNDNERMFFVTILLNTYISWMRQQRGSSSLKSVLYMDEIFGFFPPTKNPPSKVPMLLLLKQARAFGTGIILSTQNPVDIDYKGLSNIGTWFVGKLQTKQDIDKVIDGIAAKSPLNKEEISHKIATLKGRHFFMKNVHSDETKEFSTRWVLSYLKGPMTKDDIKIVMSDKRAPKEIKEEETLTQNRTTNSDKKQILSEGIKEYFLDSDMNSQTPFYPYVYSSVKVRFYNQKREIDVIEKLELTLELNEAQNTIEWGSSVTLEETNLTIKANINAVYSTLPSLVTTAKTLKDFQKSLANHLYESKKIELFSVKALKLESKLNQSKRDFLVEVEDTLKELRDEKTQKLEGKFEVKYKRLEDRLKRLETKLQKEENDVSSKTTDTIVDVGLAIFGAFFGRKAISTTTMRRGASAFKKGKGVLKERDDVKNILEQIEELEEDISELNATLEDEIQNIEDTLDIQNYEISSVFIKPRRTDITIQDIALLWQR